MLLSDGIIGKLCNSWLMKSIMTIRVNIKLRNGCLIEIKRKRVDVLVE